MKQEFIPNKILQATIDNVSTAIQEIASASKSRAASQIEIMKVLKRIADALEAKS